MRNDHGSSATLQEQAANADQALAEAAVAQEAAQQQVLQKQMHANLDSVIILASKTEEAMLRLQVAEEVVADVPVPLPSDEVVTARRIAAFLRQRGSPRSTG